MLKTVVPTDDLKVRINIANQDQSSDVDFYYQKLLSKAGDASINKIFDAELFEFKPATKNVNYFVFFLDFKDVNLNPDVVSNIESNFKSYLVSAGKILTGGTNNFLPYDFKQNSNNLNQKNEFETDKTQLDITHGKPYVVTDYVGEMNKLKPLRAGLPLFYDTFTFPFSQKLTTWKDEPKKFSDKAFLYNSFLVMEIFSSPDSGTQTRIMGIPIMVNDRYMYYEESMNKIKQLRPTFNLTEGVEGFSLFFLKQYNISNFYVKYSFWDGLSGVKIPLFPSSINSTYKKGVQSRTKFDYHNEYLMFSLDFNNRNYKMYEYDPILKTYHIEAYDIDLYQLYYDDYWAGKVVPNTRPIPLIGFDETITDSNYSFNVTYNKNNISKINNLTLNYFSDDKLKSYMDPYKLQKNYGIISSLLTTKYADKMVDLDTTLSMNQFTLFNDMLDVPLTTRGMVLNIDSVNITNNSISDSIVIKSIRVENLKISGNTIDQYMIEKIQHYNSPADSINAISYNVSNVDNNTKKMFTETYIGYSNIFNIYSYDVFFKINDVISGHEDDMIFDLSDSGSFGSYIFANYYYYLDYDDNGDSTFRLISAWQLDDNYGRSMWMGWLDNGPNDYHCVRRINPINDYQTILDNFSGTDDNLNRLFTNNITDNLDDYLFGYVTKNLASPDEIKRYWGNQFYYNHIDNGGLRFQYQTILDTLSSQIKIDQNLNSSIFQSGNKNIRDYMVGMTAMTKINKSSIIQPGEEFNVDINFYMGEMYGCLVYDVKEPLTATANLVINLEDQHKNQKKITIPITYNINPI